MKFTPVLINDEVYSSSFIQANQKLNQFNESGLTGLEPATFVLTGRCSNRLNYNPTEYSLVIMSISLCIKSIIFFCISSI